MAGRDHSIRILTPWVMKNRGISRKDAIMLILTLGPERRRRLMGLKLMRRGK